MADRWSKGTWVGKTTNSDEHIVALTPSQVIRARSVRPTDEQVNVELLEQLVGCTELNLTAVVADQRSAGERRASVRLGHGMEEFEAEERVVDLDKGELEPGEIQPTEPERIDRRQ